MLIQLKDAVVRYGRKKPAALDGITAVIGPGIHLLLGENGAGKTTLLHLIDGLRFPSSGCCLADGTDTRLRRPDITSRVCFLGDDMQFPAKTINEMVRIHAPFYPRFSAEMLAENLGTFALDGSEKLRSLSLGNRRKAMVAYMLSLRAEVILLDEPANGLDIESKIALQQMIARCIDDTQTVIVSTHTIDDLRNLFDGVIVLRHGRLQLASPIDRILRRVSFVTAAEPAGHAFHCEQRLGRWHCIVPNNGGADTDIDFRLLYTALHNPDSVNNLIKYLATDENL